jgi:pectate lyase
MSGSPLGFAGVSAFGQRGTTGGLGGPEITVRDASSLLSAIREPGPAIVRVDGVITVPPGLHKVGSDTTVVGVGSASGITGGGLSIGRRTATSPEHPDAVRNVIIANLRFTHASVKAINVEWFAHHVWIDHNELSHADDGLVDIKRGATYITVSWNHTHSHRKNMLLGHSDDNRAQDEGHLKVTYHHNWFDGTSQSNPRVRFGNPVHIFNNYYRGNSDVGVAAQTGSGCLVEGHYFEDVDRPTTIDYAGPPGNLVQRANLYVHCGPPESGGSGVLDPADVYDYRLDDVHLVKDLVITGAGVPGAARPTVPAFGLSTARRYDGARPRPPIQLTCVLTELASTSRPDVVDLGAGTGLSSLLWVGTAATVAAVEPAGNMRAVLHRNTAEQPNVTVVDGVAEATGLPDGCADIVTISNAFQWVDPDRTLREVVRLLRPGGVLAIYGASWPPRIDDEVDAAFIAFRRRVREIRGIPQPTRIGRSRLLTNSGLFHRINTIELVQTESGDARRLLDLARTVGGTLTALRDGHTEQDLGLTALAETAERRLSVSRPWCWTYQVALGVRPRSS